MKRAFFVIILLLTAAIVPVSPVIAAEPASAVSRVTTSFDIRYTGAVLKRVSRLMSEGFQSAQVDSLLKEIMAMPTERPNSWHYQVKSRGQVHQLQVRALVDDLGMIDLDFATDATLAARIRATVDEYLSRHN